MRSKKEPAWAGTTALPFIPKELIEQLTGGATPKTAEQINAAIMALKCRRRTSRINCQRAASRLSRNPFSSIRSAQAVSLRG